MAQKIKGHSLDKPAFRTPLGKPSALVIPQTPKHQRSTGYWLPILIDRPLIGVSGNGIGRPHLNRSQSICDSSPLWRVGWSSYQRKLTNNPKDGYVKGTNTVLKSPAAVSVVFPYKKDPDKDDVEYIRPDTRIRAEVCRSDPETGKDKEYCPRKCIDYPPGKDGRCTNQKCE
jgi:hypothetical protein